MFRCENELLKRVYETGFALDDVCLYLDTHPSDRDAMNYYHYVQKLNQDAIQAYQRVHGQLLITDVAADQWNWVNNPWPWEGGNH